MLRVWFDRFGLTHIVSLYENRQHQGGVVFCTEQTKSYLSLEEVSTTDEYLTCFWCAAHWSPQC